MSLRIFKEDIMEMNKLVKAELDVLESRVWGTIGPRSLSAAKAIADVTGGAQALICHSSGAAYESLLRAFGARFANESFGDVTVVGEKCIPADALVAVCVGSEPAFCPVCDKCGMLDPAELDKMLKRIDMPIRAVCADLVCDESKMKVAFEISRVCKENNVPLIFNAAGRIGATCEGKPLTSLADAVLYSLGEGSAINVGMGGVVVTDSNDVYGGTFAYHNCGRGHGDGCSLVMENIVGGDHRVTEWISAAAELAISEDALAEPAPIVTVMMKGQPVFDGEYVRKQTK